MSRLVLPMLLFISSTCLAQATKDSVIKGMVTVTVTDMKGVPRPGEQVLIRGEKTQETVVAVSDIKGKLRQALSQGQRYIVSLKNIGDTTSYAAIDVPVLEPGEFFTEDFWVNIKFEPARKYRLDNVYFDTDKATLRPGSEAQLTDLLQYLERHPSIRIEIGGHTDNTGDPTANLLLSGHRAITIRDYLVKKGINKSRIEAKGYGATVPVADNETPEGRQRNRRTEVKIL